MCVGDDILGERCSPGAGELLELRTVGSCFGEGETAYVDGVALDVPTDSVLLDDDEKVSDREVVNVGLEVEGDSGGSGTSSGGTCRG